MRKGLILMTHNPSHWNAQVTNNFRDIDLTLSGHTHGLQYGIDIGEFRISPVRLAYKQWADLYSNDQQFIYVNRVWFYGISRKSRDSSRNYCLELKV